MTNFEDATAVFRKDDGNYEATIDGKWWVFRGPHGGYITAIILRALTELVADSDRQVRSFTTHFVAPPQEGPVEIVPMIERAGRSITYTSARLVQNGKTMATSIAAFAKPWESEISYDQASPPAVPSPQECEQMPDAGPMLPTFLQNFDMRWGIGPIPYSGSEETTIGGWLRLKDADTVDAPRLPVCWTRGLRRCSPVPLRPWSRRRSTSRCTSGGRSPIPGPVPTTICCSG